MQRCLQLAALGSGNTAPNPMVGAVLVYNDTIIGEGYHRHYGEAHAEVNCLASVKEADRQLISRSTMYVSLEPCAHFGKTPPCADLLIQQQIKKVVIGCRDPFPEVDGKGIEKLRNAGIEVAVGILEEACRELNKRFFTIHQQKRPYVILKWAQTLDAKIAPPPRKGGFSNAQSRPPLAPPTGENNAQPWLDDEADNMLAEEQYEYITADPYTYGLLKQFVSEHRSKPTLAEDILWQQLRGKQLDGQKFRRQHIIGNYIADFVCLSKRLVIEVDGLIHQLPENKISDEERTKWLAMKGFTVIRFSNEEVIHKTAEVHQSISKSLRTNANIIVTSVSEVSVSANPPLEGGDVMDKTPEVPQSITQSLKTNTNNIVPPPGEVSASANPPLGGGGARLLISNPFTNRLVHKWRSKEAGILVGTNTALYDDPQLGTRLWPGNNPIRMVVDRDLRLPASLQLFDGSIPTLVFNKHQHSLPIEKTAARQLTGVQYYKLSEDATLVQQVLDALYSLGIQSLVVEGGAKLLQSFIDEGLWDEARVITNEQLTIGEGLPAPMLKHFQLTHTQSLFSDTIRTYKRIEA